MPVPVPVPVPGFEIGTRNAGARRPTTSSMQFDHEKLDVYNAAIDFVVIAHRVISTLPPGHGDLADQLRRAATSVVLNIAEGAGEYAKRDKARFYRMARRSATECAAALDVGLRLEVVGRAHYEPGRASLVRVVSMLTSLARALSD